MEKTQRRKESLINVWHCANNMRHFAKMYTAWLIISTTVVTFGSSMLFGYNIGVINTPAEIMRNYYAEVIQNRSRVSSTIGNVTTVTETKPSETLITWLWSLTVAIWVLGGMIGAFASGLVADKIGRKRALWINNFFMFLGCFFEIMPAFVNGIAPVIIGRFFVGINCGFTVGVASLYLTEISPKSIRGAIGATHQLLTTVGILLSQVMGLREVLGTKQLWPYLLAFSAIPAIFSAIFLPFCPESPRYLLLKKNKESDSRQALVRLRGGNEAEIEAELEEMRHERRKGANEAIQHVGIITLLTRTDLRLPILIAVLLQVLQQWSGVNAIFSFSESIFTSAGIGMESMPYWVFSTGVVNVLMTIIALPLLEKWGRRPLLLWPLLAMIFAMTMLTLSLSLTGSTTTSEITSTTNSTRYGTSAPTNGSSVATTNQESVNNVSGWSYLSIICVYIFICGFAVGLGPIPAMIVAELFRQDSRSAAMSVSMATNWTCNFVLCLTFRFLQESVGPFVFLIFTVIMIGCGLFMFMFAPETKNRSFEEIASHLSKGFAGASRRQSPPGAAVNQDDVEVELKDSTPLNEPPADA